MSNIDEAEQVAWNAGVKAGREMERQSGINPVAYAAFSENGNIRIWVTTKDEADKISDRTGLVLHPLAIIPS